MKEKLGLILAAAGKGDRFDSDLPKQFISVRGIPIYQRSLGPFRDLVDEAVVVADRRMLGRVRKELSNLDWPGLISVVEGGRRRQDSVLAGLRALSPSVWGVLVHDAARPFLTRDLVQRVCETLRKKGPCLPVVPVRDTVKEIADGRVSGTLDRSVLAFAQTPQACPRDILERAFDLVTRNQLAVTDEAMMVECLGEEVFTVSGEMANIKITYPEDLHLEKEGGDR